MNIISKQKDIEGFWEWFCFHEGLFLEDDVDEDNLELLVAQLERINPFLLAEVNKSSDGYKAELTISAGGSLGALNDAFLTVDAATNYNLSNWVVIPLKQPLTMNQLEHYRLKHNEIILTPFNVLCRTEESENKINITLYIEDFKDEMIGSAFHLMDRVLGEYKVVTSIGKVDYKVLTSSDTGLEPLISLRDKLEMKSGA